MTRTTVKQIVLSWLDDANSLYFTDANLDLWINQAQKQAQSMLLQAGHNWYMKPVESATVIGQSDYILPSDFIEEHRLEIVLTGTGVNENRQPLVRITTNQQDLNSITSGPPTCYYIKKDRVTLSATPDQAYVLRLYYSPIVTDLSSDSDSLDVPEEFCEYVCLLTAFNGFIKDDRAPANLLTKKAEIELLLKQMAVDRTTDAARQVVQVTDYDGGNLFW